MPTVLVPANLLRRLRRSPTDEDVPPLPQLTVTDYGILAEIVRLLTATGAFSAVRQHGPADFEEDGADHEIVAFVEHLHADEESDADDEDGPRQRRNVTYRLTIEVKDDKPVRRYQRLSTLSELACNTLNGVSLLGQTVVPLSRLTKAAYAVADHPYRQIQMTGTFTTLIDGYSGHDASTADIDHLL